MKIDYMKYEDAAAWSTIIGTCLREDYLVRADGEEEETKQRNGLPAKYAQPRERQGCLWIPAVSWAFPHMSCQFAFAFSRHIEINDRVNMRNAMNEIVLARSLLSTCADNTPDMKHEYLKRFVHACVRGTNYLIKAFFVFAASLDPRFLNQAKKELELMKKGR